MSASRWISHSSDSHLSIRQFGGDFFQLLRQVAKHCLLTMVFVFCAGSAFAQSATLTSPTPETVLSGPSITFVWTAGNGATAYQLWLGSGVGSAHYYSSGQITGLSTTVSGLPTGGQTIYARLWSLVSGIWQFTDYTYTASGTPAPAVLITPSSGSVLTSSNVAFNWSAGNGASLYNLWLGSGVGSYRYYSSGQTTGLTATATGLPMGGQTIYARLWSLVNGTWEFNDYTYTASGTPSLSVLTSPTPATQLTATTATFSWTSGNGVFAYNLWLGPGIGSYQYYASGQTNALSTTVSGLPSGGEKIYARLWSLVNQTWEYNDYTYTAYAPVGSAVMNTPIPGTQFSGPTVTFAWTPGANASGYNLWLGSGVGSSRYFISGQGTGLTATATGLPTDGQPIYARLWSYVNGNWIFNDYTYTAAGSAVLAAITSPAAGSTLPGSTVTFSWTTGTDATSYNLWLGSGPGSFRYYSSGQTTGVTATATGLPTGGQTIYARLWSLINGTWQYTDYIYTASSTP
jgi:serine protease